MKAERDFLIGRQYGEGLAGLRTRRSDKVVGTDYLPIPIPLNLPSRVAGSCLVWRWQLNRDGYGIFSAGGQQYLGHRVTFEMTRGPLAQGTPVLHLCHRPFCVQPAHLYTGTRSESIEDREARLGKLDPDILGPMPPGGILEVQRQLQMQGGPLLDYVSRRFELACASAAFTWADPKDMPVQLTLEPVSALECPGHRFDVPAGDANLCRICGEYDSRRYKEFLFSG